MTHDPRHFHPVGCDDRMEEENHNYKDAVVEAADGGGNDIPTKCGSYCWGRMMRDESRLNLRLENSRDNCTSV